MLELEPTLWMALQCSYMVCFQTAGGQELLSFCNYAFVFDAQAKTILLNADALLQMQVSQSLLKPVIVGTSLKARQCCSIPLHIGNMDSG